MLNSSEKRLEMYGGYFGGLVPLIILISILVWFSVLDRGGIQAFWAGAWIAIAVGMFFAKNKYDYCLTIMRGMGNKVGIIIIIAWVFAAVYGKLMVAGGLVEGLLWFGLKTGVEGALFTVLAYILAMLFSMGTGTSNGTYLAMAPVLYPAGVFLGADPVMLGVAILAGGVFGDNLAPISDTTIVSAYTQKATIGEVVKSRFPLSITASILAGGLLLFVGGGGSVTTLPDLHANLDPKGLIMLISIVIVIASALAKKHVIESLIYGNFSAIILGFVNGKITLSSILHLPDPNGGSTGLIQDGILTVSSAIVFALLVLAIVQILTESGVISAVLRWARKAVIKSVRQAELSIVIMTILVSTPIATSAPSMLLIGPNFVKPLGEQFNLAPARRANLMDCALCAIFFMIPWHVSVLIWYSSISTAAQTWGIPVGSITTAFLNPYGWALLAVLIFSVMTGWNRKYTQND